MTDKKRFRKQIKGLELQVQAHLKKLKEDALSDPFGIHHHEKEIRELRCQIAEKKQKLGKSKKGEDAQ